MTGETRVDKARRRVRQQPQPSERTLSLQASSDVIRQADHFEGGAQNKLTRVEHERLGGVHLDKPRQIGLVGRWIDVLILVIVEEAEEPIQSNIHAGGLDHIELKRVQANPAGVQFAANIAV
jgi:hypothetical protein